MIFYTWEQREPPLISQRAKLFFPLVYPKRMKKRKFLVIKILETLWIVKCQFKVNPCKPLDHDFLVEWKEFPR
jgi:hypothetical protein